MADERPLHWRSRVDGRVLKPAVSTDTAAVATVDGTVAALDPKTGNTEWQTRIDGKPVESAAVDEGSVVVATDNGSLFGFDAESGNRRFRFESGTKTTVGPVVADGIAFFADSEGTVYEVRCNDGTEEWRLPDKNGTVRRIGATDSLVYLGLQNGTVEGFDRDTNERRWHWVENSPLTAGPRLLEGILAYGTQDGEFTFSEPEDLTKRRGGTNWQFERPIRDIDHDSRNVAVVTEDTVFRASYDNWLSNWDRWSLSVAKPPLSRYVDAEVQLASVAVTGGIVFVGTLDGSVVVLDTESGDPLWVFEYDNDDHAPELTARDGRVVLGGTDRAVYSFRADVDIRETVDSTIDWEVDNESTDPKPTGNRSSRTRERSTLSRSTAHESGPGDTTEPQDKDDTTVSPTASDPSEHPSREKLRRRIDRLEDQLDEREDRIERLQAELDQVGDRNPRAADISRLVTVYDRLASIPIQGDDPKKLPVAQSVRGLWSLLEEYDVEEIDPDPGTPVDPAAHEVIDTEATPEPADHVVRIESSGFRLGDEVLAPARVMASNGAEAPTANDDFDGEPVVTTGPAYVYQGTLRQSSNGVVRVLTPAPDLCTHDVESAFLGAVEKWRTISSHSRTVEILDHGELPHAWAAISWDPYEPLPRRIDELDLEERLSIIEDVADAIRNADKYNIRHRRLRPSSVWLFQETGRQVAAAVANWGIKAVLEEESEGDHLNPYMAPEQLTDDPIGGYTDIYQLGALTYHLLTDVPPYEQNRDLRSSIQDGSFSPPSAVDNSLNPRVDEVVSRAMAREPRERYDSSYNFRVELVDAI